VGPRGFEPLTCNSEGLNIRVESNQLEEYLSLIEISGVVDRWQRGVKRIITRYLD